ncbi:MAG: SapC family protein [Candidatus Rokubacteria bacterium]|nr:SapC family protein [Candidatus Rokubacteria bacterium]
MTAKLLIYETVVPVSRARHGTWSVEVGADYAFSRHVNSVPLMAVEFPQAAAEYPIVFSGTDEVMPAVILGVRGTENLYLGGNGAWQARYVPAFVRRYPFVFSSGDDGKTFTLCIDEAFGGSPATPEEEAPPPVSELDIMLATVNDAKVWFLNL